MQAQEIKDPISIAKKAEIAKDAMLIGVKESAKKHGVSVSLASKLKNGKQHMMSEEDRKEFSIRLYEGLGDIRENARCVANMAMDLLTQDEGAILKRIAETDPVELSRIAHDAARTIDVTIPKTNIVAPKDGDKVAAVFVKEVKAADDQPYEVIEIERDKEGAVKATNA